ncbi:MAG: hypothetical protein NSGCLCUN01_01040 [uncultured Clostridium sp.]
MENKFSIIMPIYNLEKYLKQSIESILNQQYKNFELILINDGSTDKSAEICDTYSNEDKRIKVIHKSNEGVSKARNIGIENSNGKYLCFIDGDDWIESNMLLEMNNIISEFQSDLIVTGIKIDNIGLQGEIYSQENKYKECLWKNKKEVSDNIINLFENALINSSCNKIYKADIIKNNNIRFMNTNIGEDTRFNLEVIRHCNTVKVSNNSYYHYMRYPNLITLSRILEENSYEEYLNIHQDMINFFKESRNYSPKIENTISKVMFSQYLAVTYKILKANSKIYPYKYKKRLLDIGLKNNLILKGFKDNKATSYKEFMFRFVIRKRWYRLSIFLFKIINSRR